MHVKTKKLAIAGVTLALAMVFVLLATLINWNSLFFYIIGGFLIGAVIRLCEMKMAAGYFAASSVLGFFLAGDKVEIFTFIFAEIYILGREAVWMFISKDKTRSIRKVRIMYLVSRWLIFQLMFVPVVIFMPSLLIVGKTSLKMQFFIWGIGQVFWYLADYCYSVFQKVFETRFIKKYPF